MSDLFEEQFNKTSLTPDSSYRMDEPIVVKNESSTPKKENSDVKRWASVVKCQKTKDVYSPDSSTKSCKKLTYKVGDTVTGVDSQVFLEDYENHKGFLAISKCKTYTACKICSLELNTIPNLTNHLKTRKHEDNIIQFLKSHIPPHLYHTMEFISFSGSKLCCNLCKKEVEMSAENPQKTILNIIAHNTDIVHSSGKYNHPYRFTHAHNIIQTLAETHSDIKNNINFIDKKMMPQFKCTLCDKRIFFSEDLEKLAQNFTKFLLSNGHMKNRKAVQVLQQFSESRINEKELFIFKQGNIFCTCCGLEVEADLERLITHESGFEHSKNKFMRQDHPEYAQMVKKSKIENHLNEEIAAIHITNNVSQSSALKEEKREKANKSEGKENLDLKLKALFDTLQNVPLYLKNVNHFKINDKSSIKCFICECVLPPNTYNIKTHLLGNNHRTNLDSKNGNQATKECLGLIKKESKRSINGLLSGENTCHSSSEYFQDDLCQKHEFNGCSKCNNIELESIPKSLRVEKCRKPKTLPLKLVNKKFDNLVRKNAALRVNKDLFDNNLDGINTYCKLCKVLIPLNLNEDEWEEALLLHLRKKNHSEKLSELNRKNSDVSKKHFSPSQIHRKGSFKLASNSPKKQKIQSTNRRSSISSNSVTSAVQVSGLSYIFF